MAIPVSTPTAKMAAERLFNEAVQIQGLVQSAVTVCQTGPVAVPYLVQVMGSLGAIQSTWSDYAAIPGLDGYVKLALGDSGFSATTEATNVVTASNAVVNWLKANLPQDADGNILMGTVNATGGIINPMMNVNQLEPLVSLLQTVAGCFS